MSYGQLLAVAFLGNGLTLLGMQAAGRLRTTEAALATLLAMYAVAAVITFFQSAARPRPVRLENVVTGIMGGLGSAVGVLCTVTATRHLPGYIVFPLISGGIIIVVALIGRLAFRERIGTWALAGILVGVAGITLLSLR
jgi:drug/metabolite transporter (DMT)-like permease